MFGKQFRIFGDAESPLFLAKDVAEWIEYTQLSNGAYNVSSMLSSIDEHEKLVSTVLISGQNREMWFLTEDGLYEVLMLSRKPIAKKFKAKVKEILKDIRKHGVYMNESMVEKLLSDPEPLGHMLLDYAKEKKRRAELEKQMEEQKPKVLFADSVSVAEPAILIGGLAKILKQNGVETGQKRLFSWLRENGYLIKQRGLDYNMPTQYSMEMGLFEVCETPIDLPSGNTIIGKTTMVTGRGQIYFINKLLNMKAIS